MIKMSHKRKRQRNPFHHKLWDLGKYCGSFKIDGHKPGHYFTYWYDTEGWQVYFAALDKPRTCDFGRSKQEALQNLKAKLDRNKHGKV